ncbi:GNAT family N-acetyltransferase [Micromonospora sp. NPDC049559]|uniref:GNAT family N-acetyltransferase n=1 Tax=Micromonospora sp. NPDC049559 TaxID=3155923 RepID=UPI003420F7B0
MEIRRIRNEERPATSWFLGGYAFNPSPVPAERQEKLRRYLPYNSGSVSLIAEEAGETLATVTAIPMRQNVRGIVYPMAGVAGVATHPLARRRGHIRTLLTRLLGELRDEGHVVSALYPFRPSFYAKFGYVGVPAARTVTFSPGGLGELLRAELPGELTWQKVDAGYEAYREFTLRLLTRRHGFSVMPDYRAAGLREEELWLVTARVDGEVVGAVTYRIEEHGGTLAAGDLLTTGPLGRALLLRFFANHVDQVARVTALVGADETPELWATDLVARTEAKISFPDSPAPMARVLSMAGLNGLAAGTGRVDVEIVDDPFIAGRYRLDGGDGTLEVRPGEGGAPAATLTAAGFSALVYGVLDPAELPLRGLGTVPDDAAAELRSLFPRELPYLFSAF